MHRWGAITTLFLLCITVRATGEDTPDEVEIRSLSGGSSHQTSAKAPTDPTQTAPTEKPSNPEVAAAKQRIEDLQNLVARGTELQASDENQQKLEQAKAYLNELDSKGEEGPVSAEDRAALGDLVDKLERNLRNAGSSESKKDDKRPQEKPTGDTSKASIVDLFAAGKKALQAAKDGVDKVADKASTLAQGEARKNLAKNTDGASPTIELNSGAKLNYVGSINGVPIYRRDDNGTFYAVPRGQNPDTALAYPVGREGVNINALNGIPRGRPVAAGQDIHDNYLNYLAGQNSASAGLGLAKSGIGGLLDRVGSVFGGNSAAAAASSSNSRGTTIRPSTAKPLGTPGQYKSESSQNAGDSNAGSSRAAPPSSTASPSEGVGGSSSTPSGSGSSSSTKPMEVRPSDLSVPGGLTITGSERIGQTSIGGTTYRVTRPGPATTNGDTTLKLSAPDGKKFDLEVRYNYNRTGSNDRYIYKIFPLDSQGKRTGQFARLNVQFLRPPR